MGYRQDEKKQTGTKHTSQCERRTFRRAETTGACKSSFASIVSADGWVAGRVLLRRRPVLLRTHAFCEEVDRSRSELVANRVDDDSAASFSSSYRTLSQGCGHLD
ncbi:MAG: hypothetical protein V2A73_03495 [Pseudomonadota bacterium]